MKEEKITFVRHEYRQPHAYYMEEIDKIAHKIGRDKVNQLIVNWVFDNISGVNYAVLDYLQEYVKNND